MASTLKRCLVKLALTAVCCVTSVAFATMSHQAVVHGGKYPVYPKIDYGTGAKAALIKKGEYLAKLGDCIACHTKVGDKEVFSGGRAIKTPFGTIYTPNLTPDATGLKNWTEKDFDRALRHGVNPEGKFYYPAFPYLYFNIITKDDVKALWAYFRAIPAVNRKNKKDTMMFPFNWRFLQLGWRVLFYYRHAPGPFKPIAGKSAQWNRGYYIVQGLGHCSMCHTPSYHLIFKSWNLGAPVRKYDLTGAMVQGFYAPNITSTNFSHTPVADFAAVFKKDKLIGGGDVQGPMAEANHDSLKYLTSSDVAAIATYLESVHSQIPPKPKTAGSAEGKKVFNQYCSGCHLTGAGGAPKYGDATAWDPRIKKGLNVLYKNAINGIGGMPPKGTCMSCSTKDIQDAVQYMVAAVKPGAANAIGHGASGAGKAPKPPTIAEGKKIYNERCSVCHNGSYPNAPKTGDKQVWAPLIKQGMSVLFLRAIHGYGNHPRKGGCNTCTDAQVIAATKYMVHESKTKGDYALW